MGVAAVVACQTHLPFSDLLRPVQSRNFDPSIRRGRPMPDADVLDLSTLPTIHPRASILLGYGPATIVRLSLDPTALPADTMVRAVSVNWLARQGGLPQQLSRDIGWRDVPRHILDECPKWTFTRNAQDITEDAAIGVLALLIHNLEDAEIRSVLQIGNGGDFTLSIRGVPPLQAESSGIFVDPKGYLSTARLKKKCQQVVKKCWAGFASVVAFSHTATEEVHCYLHYVTEPGLSSDSGTSPRRRTDRRSRKKPANRKRKPK